MSQTRADKFLELVAHWVVPEAFVPRHNLKPTQRASIVARRDDDLIKVLPANWWCQFEGAKKFEAKYPMFNARVETMHDKRMWSSLLKKGQRCIVPIDSFYEWPVKGKPPVEIFLKDQEVFSLAGLWSRWYDDEKTRYSFTVFTCDPNDFMTSIHDRMPVILADQDAQNRWLIDGDESVLKPFAGEMESITLNQKLEELYPEESKKPE